MKRRIMAVLATVLIAMTGMASAAQAEAVSTEAARAVQAQVAEYVTVIRTMGGGSIFQLQPGTSCHSLYEAGYNKVTAPADVTWDLHTGNSCDGNVVASGTGSQTFPSAMAGSIETNNP